MHVIVAMTMPSRGIGRNGGIPWDFIPDDMRHFRSLTIGQTVIMVTHDASAAAIADRVLFLRDGKIVRDAGRLSAGEILDTIKTLE